MGIVEGALLRLDQRRHATPARVEISFINEPLRRIWLAQIMADPLPKPVCGVGASADDAIAMLVNNINKINWRSVRR